MALLLNAEKEAELYWCNKVNARSVTVIAMASAGGAKLTGAESELPPRDPDGSRRTVHCGTSTLARSGVWDVNGPRQLRKRRKACARITPTVNITGDTRNEITAAGKCWCDNQQQLRHK